MEGVNGSARDAPMETRVSEFVQPTGKMKNRKNWTFATLWLMEKVDVWWERRQQSIFLEDRQRWEPIVLAARAERVFPEGLTRRLEKVQRLTQKKARKRPQHSTAALDR